MRTFVGANLCMAGHVVEAGMLAASEEKEELEKLPLSQCFNRGKQK